MVLTSFEKSIVPTLARFCPHHGHCSRTKFCFRNSLVHSVVGGAPPRRRSIFVLAKCGSSRPESPLLGSSRATSFVLNCGPFSSPTDAQFGVSLRAHSKPMSTFRTSQNSVYRCLNTISTRYQSNSLEREKKSIRNDIYQPGQSMFTVDSNHCPRTKKASFQPHIDQRFFSTNMVTSKRIAANHSEDINAGNKQSKGEKCYREALDALEKASQAKILQEERLAKEQFEAMDRQRKRTQQRLEQQKQSGRISKLNIDDDKEDLRDRAAGVAVVRTIVKQSQPKSVMVNQWNANDSNLNENPVESKTKEENKNIYDEDYWNRIAHQKMEEAALRYGNDKALVRLGNEALEIARHQVHSPSTAQSSSVTSPLINGDRCKQWIQESPINISQILNIINNNGGSTVLMSNLQLSIHLYKEAGERGSSEGWFNLGHLFWTGFNFDEKSNQNAGKIEGEESVCFRPNKERAMEAFYRAMELEDADAMYFVASQHLSCDENETDQQDENVQLLTAILDKKEPLSFLSERLDLGNVPSDFEQQIVSLDSHFSSKLQCFGYRLLSHAARYYNHGPALHHLSLLHYQLNNNESEFRMLLSRAADAGHPDSLFQQAHCFYFGSDGFGPRPDYKAALENFLAAAEKGHLDAMVSAGAMLHKGVLSADGSSFIVERDQRRAFELYQRAGEAGSVEGWRNVVACYLYGEGVPKCLDTAKHIAETMLKDDER